MYTLIQLNVEGHKHIDRIVPFLTHEQPVIVTLQEVQERDLQTLATAAGCSHAHFTPSLRRVEKNSREIEGSAILARSPFLHTAAYHYAGTQEVTEDYNPSNIETKRATERFMLVCADVTAGHMPLRIATTHFTWTPDGETSNYQREDLQKLIALLSPLGDHILTGDFNAPRGKEIWSALSEHYTDNVPAQVTTTIDGTLHRAGPLPFVVDGIFSTPHYEVRNVRVEAGLSDHCALITHISLA